LARNVISGEPTRVARTSRHRYLNAAELAARLSGADQAALWVVSPQTRLKCIWSQGLADNRLKRESALVDRVRKTKSILLGRPVTIRRPHVSFRRASLPRPAKTEGWRSVAFWPIRGKNNLLSIVACYFDAATPPKQNRLNSIHAALRDDLASFPDPPNRPSRGQAFPRLNGSETVSLLRRSADPTAQILELMLRLTWLALPSCADALVAIGRSQRSPFTIVAASGVFRDRLGSCYPCLQTLSCELEAMSHELEPADRNSGAVGAAMTQLPDEPVRKRLLLAPLKCGDQVMGALIAFAGEDEDFSWRSPRVLQGIADLASTALQRSDKETQLEEVHAQAVLALAAAAQAHDGYTADHSRRLAPCAEEIARRLGCLPDEIEDVRWGAMLHDIGKIAIPEPILLKPGPLSDEEWAIVRQHPQVGERIVSAVRGLRRAAEFIRHHQERFDGKGYPDALQGERIPLGSRILAVVDSYVAIRDQRPYKPPRSHEEALAEIERCQGTQFDPRVVGVFLEVIESRAAEPSRLALQEPCG